MGNHDTLRVMSGINPHCFLWKLKTGESFTTPQAVMSYTTGGTNALMANMHDFVNNHIIREAFRESERPIVINNWEATFFHFNRRKLLALARTAKGLGVEMFVLDDGWFGKRNSDTAGLGDWTVNTKNSRVAYLRWQRKSTRWVCSSDFGSSPNASMRIATFSADILNGQFAYPKGKQAMGAISWCST
ncbi:MAG: alpha-galactosidase [Clostridia bacterium]|nr:alpha-galactosidase [Clostridia bacterium]